jgi:hypothetical protein
VVKGVFVDAALDSINSVVAMNKSSIDLFPDAYTLAAVVSSSKLVEVNGIPRSNLTIAFYIMLRGNPLVIKLDRTTWSPYPTGFTYGGEKSSPLGRND